MRTRHLMALFTGVLILAIILPISLSIWQAARRPKCSSIVNWMTIPTVSSFGRCRLPTRPGKRYERLTHTPPPPVALNICLRSAASPIPIATFREVLWLRDSVPQCSSLEDHSVAVTFPAGPYCPRRLSHLADAQLTILASIIR